MPNWVINRLSIEGNHQEVEKVYSHISDGGRVIDFEKIIPMPPSLRIESSTNSDIGFAIVLYQETGDSKYLEEILSRNWTANYGIHTIEDLIDYFSKKEDYDKILEIGKITYENKINYGYKNWYNWAIDNWGTKWGASESYIENGEIVFETAWSTPLPVIKRLSELFPDLTLKVRFADECVGDNCGEYHLKGGQVIYDWEIDEVEACILWGYDPAELFSYVKRDNIIDEILDNDNTNSSL
jgi:hypothetical protein